MGAGTRQAQETKKRGTGPRFLEGVQSRAGANSQPQRPVNISVVVRGVITRLPFSLLCS